MKVFAIHDAAGAISEFVTAPDDAPAPRLVTQAGLTMTEIEVSADFHITEGPDGNIERLTELIQNYRVIVEPRLAKLKRTNDSALPSSAAKRR